MEYHYPLLSMLALENACFRMYVVMMDDYGQCPIVIEHIAFDYYFFWLNKERIEIESDQFPKCLSRYSSMSMSRLFTEREKQMIIHLSEEIEEFLRNLTRSSRSFSLTDGQNFI